MIVYHLQMLRSIAYNVKVNPRSYVSSFNAHASLLTQIYS